MIDPVQPAGHWAPQPGPGAPPRAEPEATPVPARELPPLGAPGPPVSSVEAIARYLGPPADRVDVDGTDVYA